MDSASFVLDPGRLPAAKPHLLKLGLSMRQGSTYLSANMITKLAWIIHTHKTQISSPTATQTFISKLGAQD